FPTRRSSDLCGLLFPLAFCGFFSNVNFMNLLPFGQLPPYSPRRFVPAHIDLGDWAQIAPLFDRLEKGAAECSTVAKLEEWLLEASELSAALDEESSRRHIAMTCHTDDAAAKKAYLHFIEQIEPQIKPRQ